MCRFEVVPEKCRTPETRAVAGGVRRMVYTGHLPDTAETHAQRGFAPMVSGCPALLRSPHVYARVRMRNHLNIPGRNGLPDTTSNGAGFRCPVGVRLSFVPDTTSKVGGGRE